MMARLIGRERTLHAPRRAPAHTHRKIRYTTPGDTIEREGGPAARTAVQGPTKFSASWQCAKGPASRTARTRSTEYGIRAVLMEREGGAVLRTVRTRIAGC